jgi:hypothetical protein
VKKGLNWSVGGLWEAVAVFVSSGDVLSKSLTGEEGEKGHVR